ncbi:unnamed protein product [Dovyalis caffra]|uniref:Uncharacterized protein n=1 Tax=Dovyalis caffra TaxID=77055 RepID=A0AAV1RUC2_9ROSI|nr:unnamed protein product [Dovyalis caffra]
MPVSNDDYAQYADLVKYVHGGDWHSTGSFLNQHPQAINEKISSYNWTALHMATRAGKVEIVGNLVELMSTQALAIQDSNGNTALHLAAVAGITKMSRYMVEKNEETRSLAIVNNKGYLPLTMACANGHRDATVYLSSKTPFELLSIQNPHGSLLLQCSISNKMPGKRFHTSSSYSHTRARLHSW